MSGKAISLVFTMNPIGQLVVLPFAGRMVSPIFINQSNKYINESVFLQQ